MAKHAKTKKVLTPEEKLQQALVPVEEQPYPVPANWCWVRLSVLLKEIRNGTTIKQDKSGKGYAVTRIESLQNQTIDFERLGTIIDKDAIKESDWYISGDIVLSHINSAEHVGKTALITEDMLPLVHGMNLLRLRFFGALYPLFFQYYSQSFQYKEAILDRINMAVNQVSINQKQIGNIEFPLPPLPEQQRIVASIENLFAKLDEVKEKAQTVVNGYECRKAAILHKAFTGELTAKWRKKNGITLDSWKEYSFEKCIKMMQNGISKRTGSVGTPFAVLRLANFVDEEIIADDIREIRLDNRECEKYELHENDVLMIRVNGSKENVGKQYIVPHQAKWAFCDHIIRIRYIDELLPQYMLFFARSEKYKTYVMDNMVSSAGQNTISRKGMANLTVSIPSVGEQHQIVDLLKDLLAQQQQVKSAAESVLDQIDTMKKSILARAFRGELGTNDLADEPAIELLKKVLQEQG